jgi:hydrogenase maturation protease
MRILVAGIGNIFLGDDAFGVEVVGKLARRSLPDGVRVVDFGIRGIDLTYALLDGYDWIILVDAAPRGGSPGTLYVIEPEQPAESSTDGLMIDAHSIEPAKVLRLARAMGGDLKNVVLVGCEPSPLEPDEMDMSISAPVIAAIDEAVVVVESLIHRIHNTNGGKRHDILSTV